MEYFRCLYYCVPLGSYFAFLDTNKGVFTAILIPQHSRKKSFYPATKRDALHEWYFTLGTALRLWKMSRVGGIPLTLTQRFLTLLLTTAVLFSGVADHQSTSKRRWLTWLRNAVCVEPVGVLALYIFHIDRKWASGFQLEGLDWAECLASSTMHMSLDKKGNKEAVWSQTWWSS